MTPYIAIINFLLLSVLASTTRAKATSSETDRLSLLALKEKLTKGNDEALPSWNNSLHFCKWQGVSCTPRHMRVSTLYLTNQNFGGTLAPELGNLTFLKLLNLSYNGLHGGIPTQVGRLKRLQRLYLNNNNLEGEVPVELANCSKLQVISFTYNSFTGKVPFWFGSMLQLNLLSLGANKFHGDIPPSLGNLSSLEGLSLAYNNLEGNIPQALGMMSNLNKLSLARNNLSGLVLPSLYNLSNMEVIDLGTNHLYGTIPSNVDVAFPNLQILHFGGNLFTGIIPPSLSNLSLLQEFDIDENGFTGPVPTSIKSLKSIRIFSIDFNNLGNGGGRDLDFLISLTNCSQLQTLTIQDNGFGGKLHNSIGNLSSHLQIFLLGYNKISGTMPQEIGLLIGLTFLALGYNSLQGPIPITNGKLQNLEKVDFQSNQLSGNLAVLGNLTKLYQLILDNNNFEGSIPTNLKHCKGMQFLSLHNNKLSADIPIQTFGHLERLVTLDISRNSLTGPLPSEFGDLKQLAELDLSENMLSGDIPMELGGCLGLTKLNMSGNFLEGSILSSSFASLKSLESLDLSRNNLSGNIPHELKDLRFLKTFNISYNHLYGEVPKGGVFDNITAISLTINDGLCGGIPQLKLPACQYKDKKPLKAIIISVIVVCCVLISSIIFLILYLRIRPKKLSSSTSSLQNEHLRVSYRELHDATNGFLSSNLIGIGSFGSVYRGTLNHFERPIAVKVLNLQTRGALKSFITECKALSKTRHRNLLRILTVCSSVDYQGMDFKALVLEFMSNGSLENWLSTNEHHESSNLNLDFTQRLDIAIDVAHALDYLHHDHEESIVHCDIKPSNILLDDHMVAHLADFGLAKIFHGLSYSNKDQATSSTIKGTIGYFPPEYGAGGAISPQGDIYSYGIVLLEMVTGKKPTDNMFGEDLSLHKFCKLALQEGIIKIVDPNLLAPFNKNRMEVVQVCLVSFARIGVACSTEFPSERMGMKDILKELLAIKRELSSQGISLVIQN